MRRPLRILMVGPLPPPAGGMANQTQQLAELLSAEGVAIDLAQVNRPYRPAWVGSVKGLRAVARLIPYCMLLLKLARDADIVHVMANSGWSWHLFVAPAVWIARCRRVPCVVHYHGGGAGAFLASSAGTVRPTMRAASAVIVPSGYLAEILSRHGFSPEIVPNVVDTGLFRPMPKTPADTPHLVVTRNLESVYDNATAIRAFAIIRDRFPRARLTIAGSGPERQRLEALVSELGLTSAVRLAGRLDRPQVAALYAEAHLTLNPSLADNLPVSVLESLASGVPVVSTRVGGIPFLIDHARTGMLVDPGDPRAMAESALAVLEDEGLYQRLADAGIQESRRYTWPAVGQALFRLYERLAAQVAA